MYFPLPDLCLTDQRITSETFRFKFLNYNRAWLINQLPNILTPRTLRRSRPYLINQFTRILNQLNQDISSDSEDEGAKFGSVALTAPSRQIIRWWLAKARRRMRLREIVQPLIARARGTQCEVRLSTTKPNIIREFCRFVFLDASYRLSVCIHLNSLPTNSTARTLMPNSIRWLGKRTLRAASECVAISRAWILNCRYWIRNQRYRTICLQCITRRKLEDRTEATEDAGYGAFDHERQDRPDWGPVFLSPAARAILIRWHRNAQSRLFGKGGRRRPKAALELSDDDDSDTPRNKFERVNLNPASYAILIKWLRSARASLQRASGDDGNRRRRRRRGQADERRLGKHK